LAGVTVGAHTPGFVADRAMAEQFAEIGIILAPELNSLPRLLKKVQIRICSQPRPATAMIPSIYLSSLQASSVLQRNLTNNPAFGKGILGTRDPHSL